MSVSPGIALAAAGGGAGFLTTIFPFILIFAVFWFLLIRPQQKRMKEHKAMVEGLRRGDIVVTAGGMIGKVTKVSDAELTVELTEGVRVRVVRSTVTEVRSKTEPAPANDADTSDDADDAGEADAADDTKSDEKG